MKAICLSLLHTVTPQWLGAPVLPLLALTLLGLLAGCGDPDAKPEAGEQLPGGGTTVQRFDKDAFSMPAANLAPLRRMDFFVGNAFFRGNWHVARDGGRQNARVGLGPLFNTDACQSCHIKDGRGVPPAEDSNQPALSSLLRLSIPATAQVEHIQRMGVMPEPTYGAQLQDMAIDGHAPEGRIYLRYQPHPINLANGEQVILRKPLIDIRELGYGPLHPQTQMSLRVAPPMIGLGLLEAIRDSDIEHNAAQQAKTAGPVRGQVNQVWDDLHQRTTTGRFGWKAGQPNLDQQNAHAFAGDMGLTTRLLPADDCTEQQIVCRQAPQGGTPEVSDRIREQVLFYTRTLGVPARRGVNAPRILAGKGVFHRAGCAACHRPSYVTGEHPVPELSGQRIFPYTDLLLHDMGEGLADQRSEFRADGRQWRTTPLWGLGLTATVSGHTQLLHDGRARNVLEAILWHGGEASQARDAVIAMDHKHREALLMFLQSL